jgi:predicted Rossmann fold nucleotide-binding protein DprA/Smf involved in DNA uptake
MTRIIAITGNRKLAQTDFNIISQTMEELVKDETVSTIYFGGAIGSDTLALNEAAAYKYAYMRTDVEDIDLICVVPDTLDKQPFKTQTVSKHLSSKLIELKNKISPDDNYASYHARNHYMVNNATEVVAFWNGDTNSGTWSTIKYAKATNKPVTIVNIQGTD